MAVGDKQKTSSPKPPVGKDTLWLVKTGDRILGPFNSTEIIRRLRAKEIVVIDEVISPQSRWRHIRDEPLFTAVVEEIRTGLMTVRDDTEVGDSGTPTHHLRVSDDGTPTPVAMGSATSARFDSSINVSRISDADIVSETDDVEPIRHASAREIERPSARRETKSGKKSNVHSTLAYTPPNQDSLVSKTSKALWGLVAVAVVVIGGSFYYFKVAPVKRAAVRSDEITRFRREADRAWARGEFQRAQKLYEQINRDTHVDLETDLRHAILQLRVARETLAAKRRLEELIPQLPTAEAKTRARVALATASLQSDEPAEAEKALSTLIREPDAGPIAYFNLGCAQAASGKRSEAIQTLAKLEAHPSLGAPARLLRAMVILQDGDAKSDSKTDSKNGKLAAHAVGLEDQTEEAAFRQELYAVGAVADWLEGNKKRSNSRLRTALDTDPMQSDEFFYDPLVYLEAVRWKQLMPLMKEHAVRVKSNSAKAMYALSMIKADRRSEAQQYLSESLSPRVNDSDLQAVSSYGLLMQGRDEEARGALKFTKGGAGEASSTITAILEARLDERAGDRNAADTIWADLAKRPHPPIAALVSVARVDSQIANEKSVAAVERLKMLYPNSIPVIKLYDDVFTDRAEKTTPEKSAATP